MDIRKIKKLVELLEDSDLAEIEISENDESVRLSRLPANMPVPAYAPPPVAPAAVAPAAPAPAESAAPAGGDVEPEPEGHVIRSPMVGTFYASPNPESDPFVRVGQEIRAGDVVCIVEAMKMFNQIESDVDGKVISMLVETGQPVEFDQPLMIVR
ncbi:MAG: acetyl-CoA carboxylase biotin carboxyl carrier protein [Pseudomonadota bacterium]